MKVTRCSVEGCDRGAPFVRDMCRKHYKCWWDYGVPIPKQRNGPAAERLAAGLVRMPNGCLEWTGYTDRGGYGQIGVGGQTSVNGRSVSTHRLTWTLIKGPIPDGLHVLHHCDNPPCCETAPSEEYPEGHLFLGTHDDNMADMAAKGRAQCHNAAKTHCPANHPYDDVNTYVSPNGKRHCRICKQTADVRHKAKMKGVTLVKAA